jgi:hypothetical protein
MATTFALQSFALTNTRSVHEDTNYVSFGLSVNGKVFAPLSRRMGNVNNGTHQVALDFAIPTFTDNDEIVISYLVINHGGGNTREILTSCEHCMTQTVLKDFSSSDAQLVPVQGGSVPKCMSTPLRSGSDMNVWWNQIESQFNGVSTDRCDGPVAIDRFSFFGSNIGNMILNSNSHPLSFIYLGIDSAIGCGSNSDYSVQWAVSAT